ncbi:MAG: glycosyltransferase family 2 protein [Porphyromonadaceae bacterium]|nr:glycosyltransferase family 2 protein [Porphyromonadaceae bacterium]
MQEPLISVITICYNAELCIERTLRSVSEQTYKHIEYIIIDGASTDGTLTLVTQLAPTAEVLSDPDRGIYDAMNKGLARASGDYVWFMNAGDAFYSAQTVAQLVEAVRQRGECPDIIYGDTMLIDSEGRELGLRRLRPPQHLSADSFRAGMLVCHQAFVCRRSLAPRYDLRYRYSADVDWCIRAMQGAKTYLFISSPIACYLREGATTRHRFASLRERFDVMRRHYGLVPTLLRYLFFALRLIAQKLFRATSSL